MLLPGVGGMRGSMVIRLRSCVAMSTPPSPTVVLPYDSMATQSQPDTLLYLASGFVTGPRLKLIPGTIFVQIGSPDEDEVLLLCTPAALFSIGVWIASV